jgi:hypothetical protein
MPRRNPEDIDLGAIRADLEFLIERVTRFRKEQALKPLYLIRPEPTREPPPPLKRYEPPRGGRYRRRGYVESYPGQLMTLGNAGTASGR